MGAVSFGALQPGFGKVGNYEVENGLLSNGCHYPHLIIAAITKYPRQMTTHHEPVTY